MRSSKPTFASYLASLEAKMAERGVAPELFVMQSAGSIAPLAAAVAMPSLPGFGTGCCRGGGRQIGAALGFRDVLSLEIGGTTAKSTLIEDGEPRRATESEIGTPIGVTAARCAVAAMSAYAGDRLGRGRRGRR